MNHVAFGRPEMKVVRDSRRRAAHALKDLPEEAKERWEDVVDFDTIEDEDQDQDRPAGISRDDSALTTYPPTTTACQRAVGDAQRTTEYSMTAERERSARKRTLE